MLRFSTTLSQSPEKVSRMSNLDHRFGEVTLTVLGTDRQPAADRLVTVAQRRHAFAFGNIGFDFVPLVGGPDPEVIDDVEGFGGVIHRGPGLDVLAGLWTNLFNTATLPFYWGRYEPLPGVTDAARLENDLVLSQPRHGEKRAAQPAGMHAHLSASARGQDEGILTPPFDGSDPRVGPAARTRRLRHRHHVGQLVSDER